MKKPVLSLLVAAFGRAAMAHPDAHREFDEAGTHKRDPIIKDAGPSAD